MDDPQELNELASAFRHALQSRKLTVNAAAQRFEISREALTKMWNGRPTTLDVAERFARAISEEANKWRELNGFQSLNDRP